MKITRIAERKRMNPDYVRLMNAITQISEVFRLFPSDTLMEKYENLKEAKKRLLDAQSLMIKTDIPQFLDVPIPERQKSVEERLAEEKSLKREKTLSPMGEEVRKYLRLER